MLGAGGKMGFDICTMARRAFNASGEGNRRVIAASRFHNSAVLERFKNSGIETISVNLLADNILEGLPDTANVLYLVGTKFGSSEDVPGTWAINTFLPGLAARRYAESRIVALSTGNVYPLSSISRGGSSENDVLGPVGEYAQSCLGRERIFSYYADHKGTPVCLIRLNYANALRYGVVTDIALKVQLREPIDLAMGFVNVIWQGDANNAILSAFSLATSPARPLNVAGPETAAVRWIANKSAELLGTEPPVFTGTEAETALLSNASLCHETFGYPTVPIGQLIAWSIHWLQHGGKLLQKPTGFQVRDGKF